MSLFTLNQNPEYLNSRAFNSIINNTSNDETMAPLPEPVNSGIINIVKDFKWTKTLKNNNTEKIPTLRLEEYYITQPAFLSNLGTIFSSATEALISEGSALIGSLTPTGGTFLNEMRSVMGNVENSEAYSDSIGENMNNPIVKGAFNTGKALWKELGGFDNGIDPGPASYMKAYENLYGVAPSKFKYYIPYFESSWKKIETKFGDAVNSSAGKGLGAVKSAMSFLEGIGGTLDTIVGGFGIDFAQKYEYPAGNGPSTSVTLILDNTFDSLKDTGQVNSYQKNWELIFLLLYQNLPNKRNRLFFDPPVIYKADVPGVLNYLYSYIASMEVESLGNRQRMPVLIPNIDGGSNNVKTLIPEAFKLTLNIKSLLPETKNLFLNSYQTSINTSIS